MTTIQVVELPVEKIRFNEMNSSIYARPIDDTGNVNESKIQSLIASMDKFGQKEAIAVVQLKDDNFSVISGNRRLAAAIVLKWETIKAIVLPEVNATDEEALIVTHNVAREKTYAERLAEFAIYKRIYSVNDGEIDDDFEDTDFTIPQDTLTGRGAITIKKFLAASMNMGSTKLGELLFVQKHQPDLIKDIDNGAHSVHSAYELVKRKKEKEEREQERERKREQGQGHEDDQDEVPAPHQELQPEQQPEQPQEQQQEPLQEEEEQPVPVQLAESTFDLTSDSDRQYANSIVAMFAQKVRESKGGEAFSLEGLLKESISLHERKVRKVFTEQQTLMIELFGKMDACIQANDFTTVTLDSSGNEGQGDLEHMDRNMQIKREAANGRFGRDALDKMRLYVLRGILCLDNPFPQIRIAQLSIDLGPYEALKGNIYGLFKKMSKRYTLQKEIKGGRITPQRRKEINRDLSSIDNRLHVHLRTLCGFTPPMEPSTDSRTLYHNIQQAA